MSSVILLISAVSDDFSSSDVDVTGRAATDVSDDSASESVASAVSVLPLWHEHRHISMNVNGMMCFIITVLFLLQIYTFSWKHHPLGRFLN